MTRSQGGRKPQLSKESIVEAAVRVLDAEGLEALTMRRLGTELGTAAMSLYRHVPNRGALLGEVVNQLFAEAMAGTPSTGDLAERLLRMGRNYRAVLLAHPRAVPLLATCPVDPELAMSALAQHFAAEEAVIMATQSVAVFVLGHALAQVGSPDGEPTRSAETAYYDEWFESGLTAMVRGFTALPG